MIAWLNTHSYPWTIRPSLSMYQSNEPGFLLASRTRVFPSNASGASTSSAIAKIPTDCAKSGSRSFVISATRGPRNVATSATAVRNVASPIRISPISRAFSLDDPRITPTGALVHVERGESPSPNVESTTVATPAKPSQKAAAERSGSARPRAPSWSGAMKTARPSASGRMPPYVSSVPCIVITLAYIP